MKLKSPFLGFCDQKYYFVFLAIATSKISLISSDRLQTRRNDLDNLVKPVLDGMIRMGIIEDDADIFHLESTKFPTSGEEEVHISVKEWN